MLTRQLEHAHIKCFCGQLVGRSILSSTGSWYLVLRTWSVPSPGYFVRLQRAADYGPRTTDGPSTKYPAQSTAI